MSYAPGSPASIWALDGISDGAKLTVMWWWGRADHAAQQDTRRCTVWAPAFEREDGSRMTPNESLLEDLRRNVHRRKADRTIRHYIEEIETAGLAIVDGRCVDLVPPSEAVARQKSASPRPKSAGKNLPVRGQNLPGTGKDLPVVGKNLPSQLDPPSPPTFPHEPPTLGESTPNEIPITTDDPPPTSPPQIASSTPPVSESGDDPPCPSPSPSPPRAQARQPRKQRPEPEAQAGLDLGDGQPEDPVSIAVLALLADHRRLRREAQAANGLRETDLPTETSGAGASLRKRLRRAIEVHGEDACRRALVYRAAEWREDPGALERWSTDSMWSPKSLAVSIPAGARASPGSNRPRDGSGGMANDAKAAPGVWESVSH